MANKKVEFIENIVWTDSFQMAKSVFWIFRYFSVKMQKGSDDDDDERVLTKLMNCVINYDS